MSERIVIIDGNSLINRAYYAMQKPNDYQGWDLYTRNLWICEYAE